MQESLKFHPFRVDKRSSKIAWELKIEDPELGWLPDRPSGTSHIRTHGQGNKGGHRRLPSLMESSATAFINEALRTEVHFSCIRDTSS